MKLKKIASLMLAGIMAVSMLAGCKSGTTPDDDSSSSQVPAATNVATYANDMLSGSQKEVFTFVGSSELDSILDDVANNKDKYASTAIEDTFGKTEAIRGFGADASYAVSKMLDGVKGKLDGIVTDNFGKLPATNVKTQKAVELYTISGAYEEKAAVQKIVDAYLDVVEEADGFKVAFPAGVQGSDCEYTAEISAVKVASAEHSEKTAWVVAMVFTQTATVTANA